jgi:hypothetical protein
MTMSSSNNNVSNLPMDLYNYEMDDEYFSMTDVVVHPTNTIKDTITILDTNDDDDDEDDNTCWSEDVYLETPVEVKFVPMVNPTNISRIILKRIPTFDTNTTTTINTMTDTTTNTNNDVDNADDNNEVQAASITTMLINDNNNNNNNKNDSCSQISIRSNRSIISWSHKIGRRNRNIHSSGGSISSQQQQQDDSSHITTMTREGGSSSDKPSSSLSSSSLKKCIDNNNHDHNNKTPLHRFIRKKNKRNHTKKTRESLLNGSTSTELKSNDDSTLVEL